MITMRNKTTGSPTKQATQVKQAEQAEQGEVNMGVGWAIFQTPHQFLFQGISRAVDRWMDARIDG